MQYVISWYIARGRAFVLLFVLQLKYMWRYILFLVITLNIVKQKYLVHFIL